MPDFHWAARFKCRSIGTKLKSSKPWIRAWAGPIHPQVQVVRHGKHSEFRDTFVTELLPSLLLYCLFCILHLWATYCCILHCLVTHRGKLLVTLVTSKVANVNASKTQLASSIPQLCRQLQVPTNGCVKWRRRLANNYDVLLVCRPVGIPPRNQTTNCKSHLRQVVDFHWPFHVQRLYWSLVTIFLWLSQEP